MPQAPGSDTRGEGSNNNSPKFQYRHVPLTKPGTIRLLRLLPHPTQDSPLQCQLLEYPLLESVEAKQGDDSHLYEALSYVWGNPEGDHSISIDGHDLSVTANLHAALQHLRNRHLERVLWVDAVCINQGDDGEKEDQIRLMASVYSQASRVVVWLGEGGDERGDWALQEIRRVAAEEMSGSGELKISAETKQGVLALLRRQWFERIWVLQEVAAARSVLIKCGTTGIDGYAFSAALNSAGLDLVYEAAPDLRSLIRPVTYLIRGAVFRQGAEQTRISIRPLGELMDMYHTRQATVRHDKVFALLGMSSDLLPDDLSPNYGVEWHVLLKRVVGFLLGNQVTVETWPDTERAVIRGRGAIIGKVSLTTQDSRNNQQQVAVVLKDTSGCLDVQAPRIWTLPPLTRPAKVGDLLCFLDGVARPMLVRHCNDYFSVIAIAAPPLELIEQMVTSFPLRMLLVWDWEATPPGAQGQEEYSTLAGCRDQACPESKDLAQHSSKRDRLWDAASVLDDGELYGEAAAAVRQVIEAHEAESGGDSLGTLAAKEKLAQVYRRSRQWQAAKALLEELIQARKRVQGARHPDTLRNRGELASTYEDEGSLMPEKLKTITAIIRHGTPVTRGQVIQIAGSMDAEVLRALLDHRSDEVKIAQDVVRAAAGNLFDGGASMKVLLDCRDDEVKITENVLVSAAGNGLQGLAVLAILLQRRKAEVNVTTRVLEAATRNRWQGVQITKSLLGVVESTEQQLELGGDDRAGASLRPFELRDLRRAYNNDRLGLFTLPPIVPNWRAMHGQSTLQIVAVHGLLGDCYESWTSESPTGTKTLWLNDLLLPKLPNTHVMTYGYNAALASPSVAGVRENVRTLLNRLRNLQNFQDSVHIPLVFIGHGMGGIIIKQALTIANNERRWFSHLADRTKGIVFFSTPHRGVDSDVAGVLSNMAKVLAMGTRGRHRTHDLDYLRPNSVQLKTVAEDFQPIASKYALVSFIETEKTRLAPGLHRKMVEKHSAVMGYSHEVRMYLERDHFSMCKFEANDTELKTVWWAIQQASRGPWPDITQDHEVN